MLRAGGAFVENQHFSCIWHGYGAKYDCSALKFAPQMKFISSADEKNFVRSWNLFRPQTKFFSTVPQIRPHCSSCLGMHGAKNRGSNGFKRPITAGIVGTTCFHPERMRKGRKRRKCYLKGARRNSQKYAEKIFHFRSFCLPPLRDLMCTNGSAYLRISAHICVKKYCCCMSTHKRLEFFSPRKNAKRAKNTKMLFWKGHAEIRWNTQKRFFVSGLFVCHPSGFDVYEWLSISAYFCAYLREKKWGCVKIGTFSFFIAKPRLSQARALLCRNFFVLLRHAKYVITKVPLSSVFSKPDGTFSAKNRQGYCGRWSSAFNQQHCRASRPEQYAQAV